MGGSRKERVARTYRDFDALAFAPKVHGDDDHIHQNHVQKRLKTKTSEVLFDPAQHK